MVWGEPMVKAFATLVSLLGFVVCAEAQTPRSTWQRWQAPTSPQQPVATSKVEPQVVPARAEHVDKRLAEILLELELLADPVTFPYGIEVHAEAVSSTLHLCGSVPDRAVRDHALMVAQRHWSSVSDDMSYQAAAAGRPPNIPPVHLQKAALAALQTSFPQPGHLFFVQCDAFGQLQVNGFMQSFEDKLAVSRRLRDVAGCACVINLVHVTNLVQPPLAVNERIAPVSASSANTATVWSRAAPSSAAAAWSADVRPTGKSDPPVQVPGSASAVWNVGKPDLPVHVQGSASRSAVTSSLQGGNSVVVQSAGAEPPRARPSATQGLVLVPEKARPAPPVAALKDTIVHRCGLRPQEIELLFGSARDLEIVLMSPSGARTDEAIEKLVMVPELTAYHVSIRIASRREHGQADPIRP